MGDTKTTHTQGPWNVDVIYLGDCQHTDFVIRSAKDNMPDGSKIAIVSDGRHVLDPKPNEESQANARLISAAPELLAFARAYLATWPAAGDEDELAAQARAAVAKAEGKNS